MAKRKPHIVVGAAVISDAQGRILLCRRIDGGSVTGLWEFPGGKCEPGEDMAACVQRECREELGIELGACEPLDFFATEYPDKLIDFGFVRTTIVSGEPHGTVHDRVEWVAPSDLLSYDLCPADVRVARYLSLAEMRPVAVVGGGAAGICAAIAAARAGAPVVLLEAGPRIGKPILATGNGRCNYTNTGIVGAGAAALYRNAEFVAPTLERYPCERVLRFFRELGLEPAADKPQGRVYPRTNMAASVVDVLRLELECLGVVELTEFKVASLETADDGTWAVTAADGRTVHAGAVVLASGGAASLPQVAGHRVVEPRPVLCALGTDTAPIKGLDGVRVDCRATLRDGTTDKVLSSEEGELLFRTYGVSGICIFNLSRFAKPGDRLCIDLVPELDESVLVNLLDARKRRRPDLEVRRFLLGLFPRVVGLALLQRAGIDPHVLGGGVDMKVVARAAKRFELEVTGPENIQNAQVTRGGLAVDGFDAMTLASRTAPGLFAAGEALDVDGPCGGYNLHWAWTSGLVAGQSAAAHLLGADA